MKIKRIAIIGGGTAGWLAANHLGAELCHDPEFEITLIESLDVPTIGVGEGSVPYLAKGLKRFGISEAEMLLTCDATFKQGIKFVNWLDPKQHGENHYYHSFDTPYPAGVDVSNYWLANAAARPFDDVGIQARICELGLSPKRKGSGDYEGALSYAYHFNALKFAGLLANNAKSRFNVKHQFATIKGAEVCQSGRITHLVTADDTSLAFDFYVDCSGFASILIDKTLKVPFVSKANELLTDTVLVQQVALGADEEINPYTTATAHKAGWIWDIPLTTRRGTGFVYSSRHMSDEEALGLYADYLNVDSAQFNPRKIPMKVGYRETFWHHNCVALGLAQGFVEPLEATSILVSDFSAELLARNFPRHLEDIDVLTPHYNQVTTYVWERVVDFIKLHYCISDRTDSDFWLDNKNSETISQELYQRLARFALKPPHASDFFGRFELFDHKNFLYVLYGMKFNTAAPVLSAQEVKHCEALMTGNDQLVVKAASMLLKHRDWLEGLKQAFEQARSTKV